MKKRIVNILICLLAVAMLATLFVACDGDSVSVNISFGIQNVADEVVEIAKGANVLELLNGKIPQNTGYDFDGWYVANGEKVSADTVANGEISVIAKWSTSYTVEVWLENASGEFEKSNAHTSTARATVGESVTAQVANVAGYAFDTNNASNVKTATIASGTTFKHYFKRAIVNVKFDKNLASASGVMAQTSKLYGDSVVVPDTSFTSNFVFGGWNTSADGTGTAYAVGDTLQVGASDVTLFAQWKTNYTVETYLENTDGTWAMSSQNNVGYVNNLAIADTTSASAIHEFDEDNQNNVISAVVGESGVTLKVYFSLKMHTVTYYDDTQFEVKHGATFVVKDPNELGEFGTSYVLAYSNHPMGDGVVYEFGQPVTVTGDMTLYTVEAEVYHDVAESGDVVLVRRTYTGLGSAILVKDGALKIKGFLTISSSEHITFDVTYNDVTYVGKIDSETNTFAYRNEQDFGTFIYYDHLFDVQNPAIMLATDGFNSAVLAMYAQDGSGRIENYSGVYHKLEDDSYMMQYYLPSRPSEVYQTFFKLVKQEVEIDDVVQEELDGLFMLEGEEYGTNMLIYNRELQSEYLYLDGFGEGEMFSLDNDGNEQNVVSGYYYASENFTSTNPEYIFAPKNAPEDAFYFVLSAIQTPAGDQLPVFIIKRGEAGTYTQAVGQNYPSIIFDGYGTAQYWADEDNSRTGYYSIQADEGSSAGYIVTIEFYDEDGGTLSVILDLAQMTFATFEGGFVIDATNTLIQYEGTSSVIVIPDGVVAIAENVFKDVNITSLTIPASVTSIGNYAFQNSAGPTSQSVLKTVYMLGATPPTLGEGVFRWPSGEFKIIVPDGQEQTYKDAESWANYAQYVTSNAEIANKPLFEIENGVLLSYNNKDENPSNVQIVIPDEVTEIAEGVFANRLYIVSVDLNNVVIIGNGAFYGCENIASVTFNANTQSVGDEAFYQCRKITSIDLGAVKTIGANAFNRCFELASVKIGNKIESIGSLAFAECAVNLDGEGEVVSMRELVVTITSGSAPMLGGTVFNGSTPRIYLSSYAVVKNYAQEPTWISYATSFRLAYAGEDMVWYAKNNLASKLVANDHIVFDDGTMNGVYYVEGNVLYVMWLERDIFTNNMTILEDMGTISGNVMTGLDLPDSTSAEVPYTFLKAGAQVTYTSPSSDVLVATAGETDATFNGDDVTLSYANYRVSFVHGGYTYYVSLASDNTFTYTRDKVLVETSYTAADGSTLTIYDANIIQANGSLKDVNGLQLQTELKGWYLTDMGEGVYTWIISWQSDRYQITATTSGNTFTYEWEFYSTNKTLRDDANNNAVVTVQNGEVSAIIVTFKSANGDVQDVVDFVKVNDTTYTITFETDVEVLDGDGIVTGYEPSIFNGTYTLTIDLENLTMTLVEA